MRSHPVRIGFGDREQTIENTFQLTGKRPVVHRRREYHNIGAPVHRINFLHIILLNTGGIRIFSAAETPSAAVNRHSVQIKPADRVSTGFRPPGELPDQRRRVAVQTRASIENQNSFAHLVRLLSRRTLTGRQRIRHHSFAGFRDKKQYNTLFHFIKNALFCIIIPIMYYTIKKVTCIFPIKTCFPAPDGV